MSTNIWHEKGIACVVERRFREALTYFSNAIDEEPDVGIHYSEAALAFLALRERDKALAYSSEGMKKTPADKRVRAYHATILIEHGYTAAAQGIFKDIIAKNPDYAPIYCRYGQALITMGQLEEAEAMLRKGIELDPFESRNYYHLVRLTKLEPSDSAFQQLKALAPQFDSFPTNKRIDFHFALGQALYALGDPDLSFEHLIKANDIRHAELKFEDRHVLNGMMANAKMVDQAAIEKRSNLGYKSDAPIFIVSMPRSGSTLVEQMLASHPEVLGLEEHGSFDKARQSVGGFQLHYEYQTPEEEHALVADKLQSLGKQYVKTVYDGWPKARDYKHFTDKSIDNYQNIGWMHLALPKARFIHLRRSILDTCLSIFTMQFSSLSYSYNLTEIGKYYRIYDEMMTYWRSRVPGNLILDVNYEDLVENFEITSRRIINFCGLDWDDRVLNFHETKRVVKTASNIQVRQPLYRSSLKRLRPNDELLKPLYDGLGPRLAAVAKEQELLKG